MLKNIFGGRGDAFCAVIGFGVLVCCVFNTAMGGKHYLAFDIPAASSVRISV